jgi:hypothetical protein
MLFQRVGVPCCGAFQKSVLRPHQACALRATLGIAALEAALDKDALGYPIGLVFIGSSLT